MTTATRRLRRTSVAGLAAFTAAGVALVGAGSPAFAFSGASGTIALASGGSAASVYPGTANQALPNVVVTLANTAWVAGDYFTFGLSSSTTAITAICATNTNVNNTLGFTAAPTVAASDSGGNSVANPVVTLQSSANCSAHDEFQAVLPAPPSDTGGTTTFTISGLSVSAGTGPAITAATAIDLTATASNGTPFAGPTVTKGVAVGAVTLTKVSSSGSIGVSPSQTGVTPPTITVTDVQGGTITTPLSFTLSTGDTWTTLPTLTSPSGVTASTTATTPTNTISYVLAGTVPANGVFTLSGGVVSFGTTTGSQTVTVKYGAGPTTLGAPQIAFSGAQNRVGGADRYATAALLFNEAFANGSHATAAGITPAFPAAANATSVVVTSGVNFPDALSSAYLAAAGTVNSGILLTDPNTLSQSTQNVLINGSINTVYIVGGTAAVSQGVQNSIAALHVGNSSAGAFLTVVRVAGADRYATNQAADLNAGVVGTGTQTAVIATGANYADALAASPAIAKFHYPLILTTPTALSQTAINTITALGVNKVIILGGTSAVSAAVETALGKLPGVSVAYRIAGADRTLTAQQVALWETVGLPASGTYGALAPAAGLAFGHAGTDNVDITNGQNFPDALAAGPALARTTAGGESLLLTGGPNTLGAGIPALLGGAHATYSTVSAIGLAAAVSPNVLAQANGSIS